MAVDAGLLSPTIPMSAKFSAPNIPMAMSQGMDLQQKKIETENLVRDNAEQNNDRQVLKSYEGDLYTPAGLDKATQDLKGKLSLTGYDRLQKQAQAVKDHDIESRSKLMSMNEDELKLAIGRNNVVLGQAVPLLENYEKKKAAGGEIDAKDEFNKGKAALIDNLSKQADSQGKPLFPPQVLESLKNADPEQLRAAVQQTKVYHDIAETRWKEAQTRNQEAQATRAAEQAALLKNGSPKDALHLREIEAAEAQGYISPEAATAAREGIMKKLAAPAVGGGLTEAGQHVMDDMFAKGTITAGALRGAKSNPILIDTLNRLGEKGADPSSTRASYTADVASLRKIVPQYDAVTAFEENTAQQGKILKELINKVDSSGVPVFERWARKGRQAVAGDADVSEFNAQLELYAAESAKILTNPNLTGQLSDTARAEVKDFLPKSASKEQIVRVVDRLTNDFALRRKSLEDQIGAINKRVSGETTVGTGSSAPVPLEARNPGAMMPGGKLAQYKTPEEGIKAMDDNLKSYGQRGLNTVAKVISTWAPPKDKDGKVINNTAAYIADVAKRLSVSPDQEIDLSSPYVRHALGGAIMLHESGPKAVMGAASAPKDKSPPETNAKGWGLHKNKTTGALAYIGPNGEIEPVK